MSNSNTGPERRPAAWVTVWPYQLGSEGFHNRFTLFFWTLTEAYAFVSAVRASSDVGAVDLHLMNERSSPP